MVPIQSPQNQEASLAHTVPPSNHTHTHTHTHMDAVCPSLVCSRGFFSRSWLYFLSLYLGPCLVSLWHPPPTVSSRADQRHWLPAGPNNSACEATRDFSAHPKVHAQAGEGSSARVPLDCIISCNSSAPPTLRTKCKVLVPLLALSKCPVLGHHCPG